MHVAGRDRELERRSHTRYPLEMNVRYRVLTGGPALVGVGRTLNVSSSGMLIACEQQIVPAGSRLEISLDWPVLLHGQTPLQLVAPCRVIRCHRAALAVSMERYQLRTRKPGIPSIFGIPCLPRIP
jgi:hypothetical protein